MKATLDIPDELYRKVKAKTALQGRRIRDVTVELYRKWLGEETDGKRAQSAEEWLSEWMRLGADVCAGLPPGPSGTEALAGDRGRLEKR